MKGRYTLSAAIGAALLMTCVNTTPTTAQPHPTHDCKQELIKATGKATIFGMGRARRLAIDNWQREVRQRYGERYMDYSHARGANSECESASIGAIGQLNKRCTVVGHPCAPGTPIDIQNVDPQVPHGTPYIMTVQRLLHRLGYLSADQIDGEFGPITRRAISHFQRDNRLQQTGEPDRTTFERLRQVDGPRAG